MSGFVECVVGIQKSVADRPPPPLSPGLDDRRSPLPEGLYPPLKMGSWKILRARKLRAHAQRGRRRRLVHFTKSPS